MLAILSTLLYILIPLIGFGFVIAIHEFGHFLFAKWAGVRVDTFSIGFGPVLFKRRHGETDYVLSLLPLGGYVKMLGQEDVPSGQQPPAQDPRSYLAKSAGWKALILLGGVLFNLVSSYAILLGLVAWGMPVFRPIVGEVAPLVPNHQGVAVESPAVRLGLHRGDRLVTVDGETVRSFDDVITAVIFAGTRPLEIEVERHGQRLRLPAPGAAPVQAVSDSRFGRPSLGIEFPWSNRVVGLINQPEDGLRRFDRIVAIAGEDVSGLIGQEITDRLLRHLGRSITVEVERDGKRISLPLVYGGSFDNFGAFETRAGLPVRLGTVAPGGPADRAGLRAGDWILAVDGTPVCGAPHLQALARAALDARGSLLISAQRDGLPLAATVTGADINGVLRLGIGIDSVDRGVIAVLPPALSGGPSELSKAGILAGDALVAWNPRENDVRIAWVVGGKAEVLALGIDADGWRQLNRHREPGLLGKIVNAVTGRRPEPSLADQLGSTRVVAIDDRSVTVVALADPSLEGVPAPVQRVLTRPQLGPAAERLRVGDWIADVRFASEGAVIEVIHGAGEPRWATLTPPPLGTVVQFAQEELPYQPTSAGDAIALVNDAAYNLVVKSVTLIPRLFRSPEAGGVDPNKSLTGPIGIFRALKDRIELMGFASFLKLIALVGLNLFIVNLLPIPITDGGQLLMLGVETAIRRPLPLWLRNGLMWFGVGLVGLLFVYICGLDILRLFGIA